MQNVVLYENSGTLEPYSIPKLDIKNINLILNVRIDLFSYRKSTTMFGSRVQGPQVVPIKRHFSPWSSNVFFCAFKRNRIGNSLYPMIKDFKLAILQAVQCIKFYNFNLKITPPISSDDIYPHSTLSLLDQRYPPPLTILICILYTDL